MKHTLAVVDKGFVSGALSQLRTARDVTQKALASLLDVSQASLSQNERRSNPRISTLQRYVTALGGRLKITVEFGEEEQTPPPPLPSVTAIDIETRWKAKLLETQRALGESRLHEAELEKKNMELARKADDFAARALLVMEALQLEVTGSFGHVPACPQFQLPKVVDCTCASGKARGEMLETVLRAFVHHPFVKSPYGRDSIEIILVKAAQKFVELVEKERNEAVVVTLDYALSLIRNHRLKLEDLGLESL